LSALTSSYAHGTGTEPLLGETIGANLAASAARRPDHEALVECSSGRRWSYAELDTWATDVARGLLARGVGTGDRVGIWSPNCAEWVALQYATARIGVVLVNVNPAYRTSELEFVLRQSGVRTLVSATVFKTRCPARPHRRRLRGRSDVGRADRRRRRSAARRN
jgi:fatty-acyl-CoA synthase